MHESGLDDARSTDPVERLLEDSWEQRGERASRRELTVEAIAAGCFLLVASRWPSPLCCCTPSTRCSSRS